MLSEETTKYLKENPQFQEYMMFVLEEIEKLNSIDDLGDFSNEQAGEMVKIRIAASITLQNTLSPIIDFREKKEKSDEALRKVSARYGLHYEPKNS
jgi:hypothetical protein